MFTGSISETALAGAVAAVLRTGLIRLQCCDGLDISPAVYEWDYARQLLELRILEAAHALDRGTARRDLYSEAFVITRPLLQAIDPSRTRPAVLLIDEIEAPTSLRTPPSASPSRWPGSSASFEAWSYTRPPVSRRHSTGWPRSPRSRQKPRRRRNRVAVVERVRFGSRLPRQAELTYHLIRLARPRQPA